MEDDKEIFGLDPKICGYCLVLHAIAFLCCLIEAYMSYQIEAYFIVGMSIVLAVVFAIGFINTLMEG